MSKSYVTMKDAREHLAKMRESKEEPKEVKKAPAKKVKKDEK